MKRKVGKSVRSPRGPRDKRLIKNCPHNTRIRIGFDTISNGLKLTVLWCSKCGAFAKTGCADVPNLMWTYPSRSYESTQSDSEGGRG